MKLCCQSLGSAVILPLLWLATTSPAIAQIVRDSTLPNPSVVTQDQGISVITGGTQAGANLFHSFEEFSISADETAHFDNAPEIQNIINRVTGSFTSEIDGSIRANGTANLFLINPNGIILGSNAELNIGGSFLASTASSLNFADGTKFSATAPQTTPLLTVSVPIGLQFGGNIGDIQSQSSNLQVPTDKTLALLGGNVIIDGESLLEAPDGRVELGAVQGTGTVELNITGNTIVLSFPDSLARGDISLANLSTVLATADTGEEGGGDIQVQGRRITLAEGSQIGTETQGAKPGGTVAIGASESVELIGTSADGEYPSGLISYSAEGATGTGSNVTVKTRQLTIRDGAKIDVSTYGEGAAGNLIVNASESVELIGSETNGLSSSGLFVIVDDQARGNGGNLTIETGELVVRDGAIVSTDTFGQGRGGNLTIIAADSVEVDGISSDRKVSSSLQAKVQKGSGNGGNLAIKTGQLSVTAGAELATSTFSQGRAGNLTVQANEIEVLGYEIFANGQVSPSRLFATAESGATGRGGNLNIDTNRLSIRDGAQVSVATSSKFRQAQAGNLTVKASDVELVGVAIAPNGQFLTAGGLPIASSLSASTDPKTTADGGNLSIATERLSLRDGAVVQTSTIGSGDAGDLFIQATDAVELFGTLADTRFPTSLLAASGGIPGLVGFPEVTGQGGELKIETGKLVVQDRALIAVSSFNSSNDAKGAGNLEITAETIRLDNQSNLISQTNSGQGGNITLRSPDLLLLRRNSQISATAGISGTSGDGGNITINTPLIVAVPRENSDITANAFTGDGGNIRIQAQGIFGLESRPQLTQFSDITASSEFGIDGIVEINTPNVDPSQGLVPLPTDLVDASGLIASGCGAGRQGQSEFIVTGRGGLPPSPSDTISSDTVWSDLRYQSQTAENPPPTENVTQSDNSTTEQLVEAQGWLTNKQGEVVLTAQAATVMPQNNWQSAATCSGK